MRRGDPVAGTHNHAAGATIFHKNEEPNCGCKETIAGCDSLFTDCYFQ
jgi:hypothetical protein